MRTLFTVLGIVVAVLLVLLFLLTRTPKWYQPLKPAEPRKVSPYLTHKLAPEIYNNVQFGEPFTIEVTQNGFNDIIARGNWPRRLNDSSVSLPAAVFKSDKIWLMATIHRGPVPVVATIVIKPELDEKGSLTMNLKRVKLGLVNITSQAKAKTGEAIADQLSKDKDNQWLATLSAAFLENKPIDPVFKVRDRHVRLTEFEIQDGRIVITLKPQ